jgi:hypothetical protein
MEALLLDPAVASEAVRHVARDFEPIGCRLPAADAYADAALLAEQAGLDPGLDRASADRLYAACGAVPILG